MPVIYCVQKQKNMGGALQIFVGNNKPPSCNHVNLCQTV